MDNIDNKIKCEICGLMFHSLSSHIISKHQISGSDYMKEFCVESLISEKYRLDRSMISNEDYITKRDKKINEAKKDCEFEQIECKICKFSSENLTSHIIRIHKLSTEEYKIKYNVKMIQSKRIINISKNKTGDNNHFYGKKHSADSKEKMSKSSIGKGVGVAGKYERTKEIREKISKKVTSLHLKGVYDKNEYGNGKHVYCQKANKEVYARSTWEQRFIKCIDADPAIVEVVVEPFSIEYEFESCIHRYIPDYHIIYDDCINSLWEIKRQDFIENDPKTQAKIKVLREYCDRKNMNSFVITLKEIEEYEKYIKKINANITNT